MKASKFKIEQWSDSAAEGLWDWSVWLIPADPSSSLDEVKWVSYSLHPCYPNPNRVIRKRAHGFRLDMKSDIDEEATWGTFSIRVTIALQSGGREKHKLDLKLHMPGQAKPPQLLPIAASADYEECKRVYKLLKKKSAFGYAREVLEKAQKLLGSDAKAEQLWLAQQKALCTYKDPSLPNDTRLQRALEILQAHPCDLNLTDCMNPEALGLGGAIYKRFWELDRAHRSLEFALSYYRRSYRQMLLRPQEPDYDGGAFAGINLSYLCEVMALELGVDIDPNRKQSCVDEAQSVRETLAANLHKLQNDKLTVGTEIDWWISATLLEAYVALASTKSEYERPALKQARFVFLQHPSAWERQSTGQQLLRTIRLHKRLWPEHAERLDLFFKEIIATAFGDAINLVGPMFEGKLGLALSGGGFRASLFHIGVLARMAELDALRHVEVISCVSGGSIVGAHYYLLLRELLQRKSDGDIDCSDYLELVDKLLDQFLAGVQQNIRMRVAASWFANVRMIFQPSSYSRTQRLGELYEEHLYKLIEDGEQNEDRWFNEAFITPRKKGEGWEDSFSPKLDNWHRSNKVPMLVLNATSLNTGRNWQFTASWMGEPLSYGTGIDATERLEPIYYSEASEEGLQQMRLGYAVAASSCVPALFTPIVINGLYPDRKVRLVDGGVHDNQGTRALLDQDCDALIVSDASGQMLSERNPTHGELGVFVRTNSVLQARIRIAQYQELQARERFGLTRSVTFLHLRKRIESAVVGAIGSQVIDASSDKLSEQGDGCTEYGLKVELQSALAEVRTDLDSFTDVEALALMYSGYAMADKYLEPTFGGGVDERVYWRFLDVAEVARGRDAPGLNFKKLLKHVGVGKNIAFKVWLLHPALKVFGMALIAAAAVGAVWALRALAHAQPAAMFNLSNAARSVLIAAIAALLAALVPTAKKIIGSTRQAMRPAAFVVRIAAGLAMSIAGSWLCKLHLQTFDRWFLKLGKLPKSMPSLRETVAMRRGKVPVQHSRPSVESKIKKFDLERSQEAMQSESYSSEDVSGHSEHEVGAPIQLERDLKISPPLQLRVGAPAAFEEDRLDRLESGAPAMALPPQAASSPVPAAVTEEDKVQFTVRHPKELKPNDWQKLLAYMHVAHAIAAVRENALARLGASAAATGEARSQAVLLVMRGVEITVAPELRGCRFNPKQASFTWLKDWHCVEFEVQAHPGEQGYELGAVMNGQVHFYVGPLLIGTVPIWTNITAQASPTLEVEEQSRDPYQKILPSYSHQDMELVEEMEKVYKAVGLQYLRDVQVLRSGEEWNPALLRKIEEADIFQLFWSQAASMSPYVKQEWEQALKRHEPSFIRPMYWAKPMPIPPQELQKIHFSYYEPKR